MPFDSQPTLVGKLLAARPLRAADQPALYAVASDPLIWQQHPEPERYKPAVFAKFFAESLESGGALLVHDSASGARHARAWCQPSRSAAKSVSAAAESPAGA